MDDNKALERATAISAALRCCGSSPKLDRCKAECMFYQGGYMGKCIPAMTEAAATLIDQLTAEPPNDPLTLEELRGMDGEPVWAGNKKEPQYFQWFLVDCGSAYKPFILINRHNNLMWQYMKSPAHPDGWTAYRRKPDGGGE